MEQTAPTRAMETKKAFVSVVVPAYNEQEVIKEFHRRTTEMLDTLADTDSEIIYVDDGSRDATLAILVNLAREDGRVHVLELSRNFGKEAAMTAGIDYANGDAVIVIDADLQDPPELIPEMLSEWREGCQVVCMQRLSRAGETAFKKATARAFYALMGRMGQIRIPENVGDFRLMSREAVDALKQLPERTRFMKGLFAWVGYSSKLVPYMRDARYAGGSKWNYWTLWNFALEGITSFTVAPLKIASYLGVLTSFFSMAYGIFVLGKTFLYGDPVPGYPSLMVAVLFLGGLQLLAIGVVGEYLGRIFIETKQRPLYLLNRHHGADDKQRKYPSDAH
ncbi:MAG: glycosyltransferase family 2 protein [Geobacteraceae bacterium]|nr:glycosyltransferase family 2 protein [Geobacteraceae bacterium]